MNQRKRAWISVIFFVLIVGIRAGGQEPESTPRGPTPVGSQRSKWVLSWSDEFKGPNGSLPDSAKWTLESGGNGWGNGELEYYTTRTQNVWQEDGNLVVQAVREKFTGPDGVQREYTSARLKTGKFSQRYGRFEARIQLPGGRGLWPAFWMLGEDISKVGWPACGEIDIMENIGSEPGTIHSTLHGPGYSAGQAITGKCTLRAGFRDGFHIFAVEWRPKAIDFFVDGTRYLRRKPSDLPRGKKWVFDHPFFIILNLAIGGSMPGPPDESTVFPQRMLVDYVRVYSRK